MPGTTNTFGGSSTTEYGSLLPLYYPAAPGFPAGIFYEDFRNVLASNPCTSNGSGRAKYQIANPMTTIDNTPAMTARGLRRVLPRGSRSGDNWLIRR